MTKRTLARRIGGRHLACAFLGLALCGGAAATGDPPGDDARPSVEELGLEGLMTAFAKVESIRADFVETKELALLDAPIESRGEIVILPPDRLHRRTDAPAPATLVIDGDRLRFEDALGREELDLAEQPQARQFVDHMLAVLSGDLDALRERYALDYEAERDQWKLRLAPKSFPMKHLISEIALVGDGPKLVEMRIVEVDGDVTRSRFTRTRLDAPITDEERERLFPFGSGRALGAVQALPGRD